MVAEGAANVAIQEASKAAIKQAVAQQASVQVIGKTIASAASSLGISLTVQGVVSGVSASLSSGWQEAPHLCEDELGRRGPTGDLPTTCNSSGQVVPQPVMPISAQMIENFEKSFPKSW